MDTRAKRFFAGLELREETVDWAKYKTGLGFEVRTVAAHPIDGYGQAMAWASTERALHGEQHGYKAHAAAVATRMGSTSEVLMGLRILHHTSNLNDPRGEVLPPHDLVSGYIDVRAKLSIHQSGTDPLIEGYDAVWARVDRREIGVFLDKEQPAGANLASRVEAALQRTAAYHANDTITLGLPFGGPLERYVTMPLEEIRQAAAHVKDLVTPPPADESRSG